MSLCSTEQLAFVDRIVAAHRVTCLLWPHSMAYEGDTSCPTCKGSGTVQPYLDGLRSWAEKHIGWPMVVWWTVKLPISEMTKLVLIERPYTTEELEAGTVLVENGVRVTMNSYIPALHAVDALNALEECAGVYWEKSRDPYYAHEYHGWVGNTDETYQADTPSALLDKIVKAGRSKER